MEQKQLPIEAESEVVLEVVGKGTAGFFEIKGSTTPSSWKAAVEALLEMREGKVMIIGATDVGKSTLTVFLTNRLLANRISVRVVDADIGQADLGPPTTIGSALPRHPITSLSGSTAQSLLFIGDTSPARVESKLANGIQKLSTDETSMLTIINTDGWVQDPEAILFKTKLIETIRPDIVLGLAKGNELQPILSPSRTESMNVEAARQVLARSRRDRREIRVQGYRRALAGGKMQLIPRTDVRVSFPQGFSSILGLKAEELNNLILGLISEDDYLNQIGIFMGLDGEKVRIYSRDAEAIRRVDFGYVRLTPSGREIGFFER
jgi:polynucleotide 5'-hydroxyl-kinase GRC3/NOL9